MSVTDRSSAHSLCYLGTFTLALVGFVLGLGFASAPARALESAARQVILVDHQTDTVLLQKASDETMFPASMSKLMTLYVLFEQLAEGSVSLDDTFRVSEKAWRMAGSKMFVEVNSRVSISELLRGIIVQSGNDACVVVAEGLAGSEDEFANTMNKAAKKLGLTGSHFVNSTGWPNAEHVTTARDLAILSRRIITDYPQFYGLFSEKTYTFNGIRQGNRNPLLYKYNGADGLKTGHTEASGYGLVASAVRDDRRLILVINGLESVNDRSAEAERLLDYGFREFDNYNLFKAGDEVDTLSVWLGDETAVPVVLKQDLTLTMSRKARADLTVTIVAPGPVRAPVATGDQVAELVITAPDLETLRLPLVAGADIEALSGFGRIGAAFNHLLWGE